MTRPADQDPLGAAPEQIGRYRILRELGRGGMGVVYAAEDEHLQRTVAIKVLVMGLQGTPSRLARFEREGKAVARLQHPNIVQVYDVGREGRWVYMVMELVHGQTLSDRLKCTGTLDDREAARLALSLAQALGHAHGHSILHRDLKPANVLLTFEGEPKVTDFGLAKAVDGPGHLTTTRTVAQVSRSGEVSLTKTGQLLGTPAYMSPEQARGKKSEIDARTDIYSLGATLYELLSGVPPLEGEGLVEVMTSLLEGRIRPLRQRRPDLDPWLERIVMRCLEREPAERYPSAMAVAEELSRYLRGAPTARGPNPALFVAALFAVVMLAAVLVFSSGSTPAPQAEEEQQVARTPDPPRPPPRKTGAPPVESDTAPVSSIRPAVLNEQDEQPRRSADPIEEPKPKVAPKVAPKVVPKVVPKVKKTKRGLARPPSGEPRHRTTWVQTRLMKLTHASPARHPHWATDWSRAKAEASDRNVPLVVVLMKGSHDPPKGLLSAEVVTALNGEAVVVVGQPGTHDRQVAPGQPPPRGGRPGPCSRLRPLACTDHQRMFTRATSGGRGHLDLKLQGTRDDLRIYVCTPRGAVIKLLAGGRAGSSKYRRAFNGLPRALKAARGRLGKPRFELATLELHGEKLRAADLELTAGRLVEAYKGYASVSREDDLPQPIREWIVSMLEELEGVVRKKVVEAEAQADPRSALNQLNSELNPIPVAREMIRVALQRAR